MRLNRTLLQSETTNLCAKINVRTILSFTKFSSKQHNFIIGGKRPTCCLSSRGKQVSAILGFVLEQTVLPGKPKRTDPLGFSHHVCPHSLIYYFKVLSTREGSKQRAVCDRFPHSRALPIGSSRGENSFTMITVTMTNDRNDIIITTVIRLQYAVIRCLMRVR